MYLGKLFYLSEAFLYLLNTINIKIADLQLIAIDYLSIDHRL